MSTREVQVVDRKTVRAKCIKCNVLIRKSYGQKKTINSVAEAAKFSGILDKVVAVGDILCNKCRLFICRSTELSTVSQPQEYQESPHALESSDRESSIAIPLPISTSEPFPFEAHTLETPLSEDIVNTSSSLQESSTDSDPLSTIEDPSVILDVSTSEESNVEYIEMPFSRVVATHGYCFVCGSKKGIINVPFQTRKQVFIMRRLYVPKGNRCCPSHLLKKRLFHNIVANLRVHSNTSLVECNELRDHFEYIARSSNSEIKDKVGDFTLSAECLKIFTGLTWENLINLRELMTSMRNSETRNITQAIVVFLFKLRTGNSNNLISAILGLEHE